MKIPVIHFIELDVPIWLLLLLALIVIYVMFNRRWGLAWSVYNEY